MPRVLLSIISLLCLFASPAPCAGTQDQKEEATESSPGPWSVLKKQDRWTLFFQGKLITEYRFLGYSRPVFYPFVNPDHIPLTRAWPLEEARPGEAKDHPHHRSIWFSHGRVNGVDFWGEREGAGVIQHQRFVDSEVTEDGITLTSINHWKATLSSDGLIEETRTARLHYREPGFVLDLKIRLLAMAQEVTFGDTKEGTLGIRVRPELRRTGDVARGTLRNDRTSPDQAKAEIWGKRARWVDYSAQLDDSSALGICVIDHPKNPRSPTHWHARDYGLLAANPFGVTDFEKRKVRGEGDLVLNQGEAIEFRYRIFGYRGKRSAKELDAIAKDFENTAH